MGVVACVLSFSEGRLGDVREDPFSWGFMKEIIRGGFRGFGQSLGGQLRSAN